ncbi:hypothetical protein [Soonwooa sp.]|uniref:hypothetical protein n=1 Tax=Soonwooa sp. TaxID=1938592 RepID=UPI0028A619C8|nr:hypothetical protein [Soonwooa sp.]
MAINKVFENKTIFFGMPKRYGIYKLVIKNLELMGFKVIDISFDDEHFAYKNFGEKLQNLIQKTFLGNKNYKQELKFQHQKNTISNRIDAVNNVDFALLIRPDLYPESVIKLIKSKSKLLVGYQWDGLNVFPKVKNIIPLFDRFFVFDPQDVGVEKCLGITNFYFNQDIFSSKKQDENLDLYFIGVYTDSRMDFILDFLRKINDCHLKIRFEIFVDNVEEVKEIHRNIPNLHYITEKISFEDAYQRGQSAKTFVDFYNPRHKGLSLRVFEALGMHKKLITTNAEITKHDLYKPENILVYDSSITSEVLRDFLSSSIVDSDSELIEKYSFENWIKNVLDYKPRININLPQ